MTINTEIDATTEYRNLLIRKTGSGKSKPPTATTSPSVAQSSTANVASHPVMLDDMSVSPTYQTTLDDFCEMPP